MPSLHDTLLCLSAALLGLVKAEAAVFYPNVNLTDTSGKLIQAHGGAIIQTKNAEARGGSTWYWFGQDDTTDTSFDGFLGVTCYRSEDMLAWDYLGHALSPEEGTPISNTSVVERPKVLYNAKNDEYVMWFHLDNNDYSLAQVGVATSKRINGPYSFLYGFYPLGHQSRDMTVWQDPDTHEGYLVFATDNNANLAIATLNDDYTNTTAIISNFTNVYWEAPGVFHNDGSFYLLLSPQNGWTPTPNLWMSAPSMSGPWTKAADLAPPDSYTYLTQNAYDIPIIGTERTTYVYLGDRWNGNELFSSTYSFMPLVLNESGLSMHHTGGWALDVHTGQWWDLPQSSVTAAESTSRSLVACTDGCPGGQAANMTSTQDFAFTYRGPWGETVMQVQYTYLGPRNSFLNLGVAVEGRPVAGNVLLESTMQDYTQQAAFPVSLWPGARVTISLLDWNGDEVLVEGVDFYPLEPGSSVSWPQSSWGWRT